MEDIDNLCEQDFLKLCDLIESVGRFELNQLREHNEQGREALFRDAFIDK